MPSADQPFPTGGTMGLYLHVPFCLRKCPYCSFFSVAGSNVQHTEFISAAVGQMNTIVESGWTGNRQIESVFVGGGTPSVLEPALLGEMLQKFSRNFPMAREIIETSVEVNPATVSFADLNFLRRAGYNRISIGVQSLSDEELDHIGRPHSAADAIQTIADARKAGFKNCNVDLMYGLPGQTVDSWRETLHLALDQEPDHLAIYELTIEEGTPFSRLQKEGKLNLPNEDTVLEMMALTGELVSRAGFARYEISNYAKPGNECHHNINYWRNGWYLGLGPGAVSCLAGRRYTGIRDVAGFCRRVAAGLDWWEDVEELTPEERFRETVIMGLRMMAGISISELDLRFGFNPLDYYGDVLHILEQQGLIVIEDDHIFLSSTGIPLANQVMAELV